jgi:transcriptional regulator with XRE-family HTH domain
MAKSTFTREYKTLCRELIAIRKCQNLTQTEVAKKLARPQSYVSKYEQGERRLDVVEFLQVAKAVGVDPCVILKKLATLPPRSSQ